jgi:DNA helicase-2/ATP-dependent DNA helicase PcrA
VQELTVAGANFRPIVAQLVDALAEGVADDETQTDFAEDRAAWIELTSDIGRNVGRQLPLDQFLQELQLRSKEPLPKPGTVTLMTVHGAKGREFDYVYVVGLAEDVLPSYQSRQKGDQSTEMEEERRNCFVAITRAKECLILSRADEYRGWRKAPSRFLVEMGLVQAD